MGYLITSLPDNLLFFFEAKCFQEHAVTSQYLEITGIDDGDSMISPDTYELACFDCARFVTIPHVPRLLACGAHRRQASFERQEPPVGMSASVALVVPDQDLHPVHSAPGRLWWIIMAAACHGPTCLKRTARPGSRLVGIPIVFARESADRPRSRRSGQRCGIS